MNTKTRNKSSTRAVVKIPPKKTGHFYRTLYKGAEANSLPRLQREIRKNVASFERWVQGRGSSLRRLGPDVVAQVCATLGADAIANTVSDYKANRARR